MNIRLTIILAALTLLATLSCYIPPTFLSIIAFLGLITPLLLFINILFAIYWAIKKEKWIFIPLLILLLNYHNLSSAYQVRLFTKTPTSNVQKLTLATYNIDDLRHQPIERSYKEIAHFFKTQHVDIICFQEFLINKEFTVDSVKHLMKDWPYSYIPHDKFNPILQTAVFSKYPINQKTATLVTYPNTLNCSLWCDIQVNNQTIRLFNNHLQTTEVSQNRGHFSTALHEKDLLGLLDATFKLKDDLGENYKRRARQAQTMKELIEKSPYPTLVCGDFNSTPSSYVYHTMKGDLNDGFKTAGVGYMYTYRHFKKLLRIDYIFHSDEFQGIDYYSPELDYSSHNPVIMRLGL